MGVGVGVGDGFGFVAEVTFLVVDAELPRDDDESSCILAVKVMAVPAALAVTQYWRLPVGPVLEAVDTPALLPEILPDAVIFR